MQQKLKAQKKLADTNRTNSNIRFCAMEDIYKTVHEKTNNDLKEAREKIDLLNQKIGELGAQLDSQNNALQNIPAMHAEIGRLKQLLAQKEKIKDVSEYLEMYA